MARVEIHQRGIDAMMMSNGIRQALVDVAEKIQDEAVRITFNEAVDTGLMAASWRVRERVERRRWVVRVLNTAKNRESSPPFGYPFVQEFGWRTQSGRHIPGKHILARSIGAARL